VQVQVLEFDLERDELRPVAVYVHAHEIWSITPSPADPGAFVTVHNDGVGLLQQSAPAQCRHVPCTRTTESEVCGECRPMKPGKAMTPASLDHS